MSNVILLLLLVVVSLIFSAFFSGMEIAYISANKLKIELDNKKGEWSAKILSFLSKSPAWFIAAMLIGNNIALVIYTLYMADLLSPLLNNWGFNSTSILLIQTIFSTFFILVFAEFLPKAIFRLNPNRVLKVFSLLLVIFYFLIWPVTALVVYLTKFALKFFGKEDGNNQKISFGKTDLNQYLEELKNDLNEDQEMEHDVKIFHNALSFSEVIARDCMVPRNEIIALEINDSIDELKELFLKTGFSRILIYKENIDNIIGYVHSIELFKIPKNIKSVLLPVGIIPESMIGNNILEDFIDKKRGVLVVVDEFGGTSGIITMEDIIEEIFGEIDDEHDKDPLTHEQISDKKYVFSARVEIDFINEKYRLNLPEKEEYETLGGLIIHFAETIPQKGASFLVDNYEVVVLEVQENRILKVGVKDNSSD
ncbi:MAG: hemolysin [Crocinitomicaceae bacterium]|nr:hemolysin [Crocinitomicaceae bacterium]|tara:strand:+ start:2493 stop:3764 length:1272 start_codon:yes stop_codon:yes gene_type:complete